MWDRLRFVTLLLTTAACTGTVAGPPIVGPLIRYTRGYDDAGMAALVEGVLDLEGGCLYLVAEADRYPVVWPAGTDWVADNAGVLLPTGEVVAMGDRVSGGGGYLDAASVARVSGAEAAALAAGCADNEFGEVAFFNNMRNAVALVD